MCVALRGPCVQRDGTPTLGGGGGRAGSHRSISHLLDFPITFPFPPLGPSVLEPDLGDGGEG